MAWVADEPVASPPVPCPQAANNASVYTLGNGMSLTRPFAAALRYGPLDRGRFSMLRKRVSEEAGVRLGRSPFCGTVGVRPCGAPDLFEQAHHLFVRDLLEVPVPEADGLEIVGHEQADQVVGLGA